MIENRFDLRDIDVFHRRNMGDECVVFGDRRFAIRRRNRLLDAVVELDDLVEFAVLNDGKPIHVESRQECLIRLGLAHWVGADDRYLFPSA